MYCMTKAATMFTKHTFLTVPDTRAHIPTHTHTHTHTHARTHARTHTYTHTHTHAAKELGVNREDMGSVQAHRLALGEQEVHLVQQDHGDAAASTLPAGRAEDLLQGR